MIFFPLKNIKKTGKVKKNIPYVHFHLLQLENIHSNVPEYLNGKTKKNFTKILTEIL